MKKTPWRVLGICAIACAAAIVLASCLQGGCTDGIDTAAGSTVPMKCHWTFRAEMLIGCLGIAGAAITLAGSEVSTRRAGALFTLLVFVATTLLPTSLVIGVCSGESVHACNATAQLVWVASAIGAVLCLVQLAKADPRQVKRSGGF